MEIKYLAVSDMGPFRDLHTFDFSSSDGGNGFVIFSKNGRGKTTLFNAIQWCLFGNVFERSKIIEGRRVKGKRRPIVGDHDEALMNFEAYEKDKKCQMSVTMIAEGEEGLIQVARTASSKTTLPREDDELKIDLTVVVGEESSSNRTEAQEMIEKFFPNELSRFFFIDGEVLQEYVDLIKDSQVGGIREDVEDVLRIPALTRGLGDLEDIVKEQESVVKAEVKRSRSASIEASRARKKESEIKGLDVQITSKQRVLDDAKMRFNQIEEELLDSNEAVEHITKIRDLRSKEEALREVVIRSSKARVLGAKNAWKTLLWKKAGPVHSDLEKRLTRMQNSIFQADSLESQIRKLEEELSEWTGVCSHCNQPLGESGDNHKEHLKSQILEKKSQIESLRGESGASANEMSAMIGQLVPLNPPHGTEEIIIGNERNWKEDRKTLSNIREKIDKLEEKGLKGVDEGKIFDLSEEKGKLRLSIRTLEEEIEEMQRHMGILSSEAKRLSGNGPDSDTSSAKNDLETMRAMSKTIRDTVEKFREEARKEVEERASEAFRMVINAPEALTGVIIDPNFRARIAGSDGRAIRAPSSGQEVTMTLCVLDALRQTSGINAPIFFDTPARSLDEDHKKAQLEYFWKVRDNQFIIFPHSGEYRLDEVIQDFGGEICRAWELLWPNDYEICPNCGVDLLKDGKVKRCLECDFSLDITSRNTIVRDLEV